MDTLILVLAFMALPPQTPCAPQFAPLSTGSHSGASTLPFWRKEEAGNWGGSGWLGWTREANALVPVAFVVRDRPGDSENVSVEKSADVTFAVRCIPGLRAGAIRSTGVVNHELVRNRSLRISLGNRRYGLQLRSRREDLFDAVVTLTEGSRTQVLYSADGFADEPHFDITWAGDLDRDGRLDLIVNLFRKYSWHPYRLLLSSKASANQLVGDAALFETGD